MYAAVFRREGRYELVLKYSPSQARAPAGNPIGGQWVKTIGGANFAPAGQRTAGSGGLAHKGLDDAVRNSRTPATTLRSQYGSRDVDLVAFARKVLGKDADEYQRKLDEADRVFKAGESTENKHSKLIDTPMGKKRVYSEERLALHEKILNDLSKNMANALPAQGELPTATFLAGRGGSGKSTFAKGNKVRPEFGVYDPDKVIVVDPDEVKKHLPEYDPELASVVHEESSHIANLLRDRALAAGANVVVDKTFASNQASSVEGFIKAGYNVDLYMMHLPNIRNVERVMQRWQKRDKDGRRGRLVPPKIVMDSVHNERWFDHAISMPGIRNWGLYTSDVPEGQDPRLLANGVGNP